MLPHRRPALLRWIGADVLPGRARAALGLEAGVDRDHPQRRSRSHPRPAGPPPPWGGRPRAVPARTSPVAAGRWPQCWCQTHLPAAPSPCCHGTVTTPRAHVSYRQYRPPRRVAAVEHRDACAGRCTCCRPRPFGSAAVPLLLAPRPPPHPSAARPWTQWASASANGTPWALRGRDYDLLLLLLAPTLRHTLGGRCMQKMAPLRCISAVSIHTHSHQRSTPAGPQCQTHDVVRWVSSETWHRDGATGMHCHVATTHCARGGFASPRLAHVHVGWGCGCSNQMAVQRGQNGGATSRGGVECGGPGRRADCREGTLRRAAAHQCRARVGRKAASRPLPPPGLVRGCRTPPVALHGVKHACRVAQHDNGI